MLSNNYEVELIINNEKVDLPNNFDLNLNAKVFDPESVLTKTSEYSYSFSLPTTPRNCKVFGYANVLSVPSKFVKTFNAELYSDGLNLFKGKLRISEVTKDEFKCNLVIIKVNTIEDIFGDATLNMIDWQVPFNGISTINIVNASDEKYYFPLVSYGVFAKNPLNQYETYNSYSSIYSIDYTNKFYYSTFYPSLNIMEIARKCFEYKGFECEGTAFTDKYLNNIYMSTNLGNDQVPIYNLGNPRFGEVSIESNFKNYYKYSRSRDGVNELRSAVGQVVSLEFPYDRWDTDKYNFDEVCSYNLLESPTGTSNRTSGTRGTTSYGIKNDITINGDSFMFAKEDGYITIPADGLYKIELYYIANLMFGSEDGVWFANGDTMVVKQKYKSRDNADGDDAQIAVSSFGNWNLREYKPIEIQLVRNYDDKIELIKGCVSFGHNGAKPTDSNSKNYVTAYPHQETVSTGTTEEQYPTEKIDGSSPSGDYYMPKFSASTKTGVAKSDVFLYDPMVNPDFICGVSTIGNCNSIIKNGYSWYKGDIAHNDAMYDCNGYMRYKLNDDGTYSIEESDYLRNSLEGLIPMGLNSYDNGTMINGSVYCMVYLKKDDRLSLRCLTRHYDEIETKGSRDGFAQGTYPIKVYTQLKIKAMSPNHSEAFKKKGNNFYSNSEFSENLNLGNFLNKETKMSEFIDDLCKSFNLSFNQKNNKISLDTQKRVDNNGVYAVNIDDRVNVYNTDINLSRIEYPSSLAVKYNINTSEAGFYNTVSDEHINDDDWENWGERGYDTIVLDETGDENSDEITLKNSYCWYEKFTIAHPSYSSYTDSRDGSTYIYLLNSAATVNNITIPVIAKSDDFIDRGDIESYMKKDGYSLKPRFWFRDKNIDRPIDTVDTVYTINGEQQVDLYAPIPVYDNVALNYKENQNNLLKQYFNISQSVNSNYVELSCYLTPMEYFSLKNGANVIFDSDVYEVIEIKKYSIARKNMCDLKLMKKG